MNILIIIPARAGSIRLKNKNKKKFLGKPLISHTIRFAKKIKVSPHILLTTNDPEILKIGEKNKILTPWLRPQRLSKSRTKSIEFALHAIKWFEEFFFKLDCVILLQPTSPYRSIRTFNSMFKIFKKKKKSVVTFTEKLRADKMIYYINRNKLLKKKKNQSDPKVNVCGNIYINSVKNLKKFKNFVNKETLPYVVKKNKEIVDIDTYADFKNALKLGRNN